MEFKIGDMVITTDGTNYGNGTVLGESDSGSIMVNFPDQTWLNDHSTLLELTEPVNGELMLFEGSGGGFFSEYNLKVVMVRVKATEIARRMNKGSILKEEDGWLTIQL